MRVTAPTVRTEVHGRVLTVLLCRPERRNAIDRDTADLLYETFLAFDRADDLRVAVLAGEGGTFCAGADLKAISEGTANRTAPDGPAPLGPSRLLLDKPVIAAIEGYAVAGGLELALWCDLRVAAEDAILGVFCRRVGVPLIDGGTVRLPQLIGLSRALDLILTGRPVEAREAEAMGLVNRVVPPGRAREAAEGLAHQLSLLPQACLRADRRSAYAAFDRPLPEALLAELEGARGVIASAREGATRFARGEGRHGAALDAPER
jgi:enoyl-CoA hydratase